LQRKQPQQINVFVVLAGKNGPAKQEQQKRLNTGQHNMSSLVLLLLCVNLKQLITPIQELLVAPLQYTKTDVSSTLFCHLLSGSLLFKKVGPPASSLSPLHGLTLYQEGASQ